MESVQTATVFVAQMPPVDLFFWLLAATPIVVLLVLLVGLRWSATEAAPVGMFVAAAIAFFAFQTPLESLSTFT